MPFGLFGKLPQKRDFLSVNLPTAVLNPFETWLQSAVTASRSEIGGNWANYYLVAPIWRFWLGKDILGTGITGSIMPSVDQVGRYFPLAIIYYAGPGETLVPPLVNPIEDWYAAIEQRLLSVLSENAQVDPGALLGGLRSPDYSSPPPLPVAPRRAPPRTVEPEAAPVPAAPAFAEEPEPAMAAEPAAAMPATTARPAMVAEPAWDDAEAPETMAPDSMAPEPVANGAGEAELMAAAVGDAAAEAGADDDFDWAPEPMAADRLAELDRIAVASFAPDSVWAKMPQPPEPGEDEDAVAAAADETPREVDSMAAAAFGGGVWDDAPAGAASPEEPSGDGLDPPPGRERSAISVLSRPDVPLTAFEPGPDETGAVADPAMAAEPMAASEPEELQAFAPVEPETEAAPPAPLEVYASDFKGGLVAAIEGGATFVDALPRLMALDIEHTAQTRGYWWCGPSSSGGPKLYAKSGLPDAYFYTRMLMWTGG